MSRIHIPIGRRVRGTNVGHVTTFLAVIFALVTFAMALTCFAPQLEAAELPKMLVVAQNLHLKTDAYLFLQPDASAAPQIVETESCTGYRPEVEAGGLVVIRDFSLSRWFCRIVPDFALVTAPTNVESFTVVNYDDGLSKWSFKTPPIGAISVDHPATIIPASNDDLDATIVNVFPTQPVTVYVDFYTATGKLSESFNARPPFTQYPIGQHGYGYVVVSLKNPPCFVGQSNPACAPPSPLYGLITVGRKNSASLDARPF